MKTKSKPHIAAQLAGARALLESHVAPDAAELSRRAWDTWFIHGIHAASTRMARREVAGRPRALTGHEIAAELRVLEEQARYSAGPATTKAPRGSTE